MLSIRLSRTGKTKQPYFRIIIVEKRKDPWGDCLEVLGNYNPRSKEINLEEDRIKYWLSKGAQPSDTVYNLLITKGILSGPKKRVSSLSKRSKERREKLEKEKAAAAPKPAEAKPTEAKPAEAKPTEAPKPAEAPKTEEKK